MTPYYTVTQTGHNPSIRDSEDGHLHCCVVGLVDCGLRVEWFPSRPRETSDTYRINGSDRRTLSVLWQALTHEGSTGKHLIHLFFFWWWDAS